MDIETSTEPEPAPEPLINPRKPLELARECPIDIYLSGCDGGGYGKTYFPWAYRMGQVGNTFPPYYTDCDSFILDSTISDANVTTDEVIDVAREIRPDFVLPADIVHDQTGTTERVHEFLDLMDDRGIEATPIIPLQPDGDKNAGGHDVHYKELEGLSTHYAIGGVKDAQGFIQRNAAEGVRNVAGDDIHLHGLGFGMGYLNNQSVRDTLVLDSIDCSTPIQEGRRGRMHTFTNGRMRQIDIPQSDGDFALLQVAMASGTTLIALARQIMNADATPVDGDLTPFIELKGITDGGTMPDE